MNRISKFVALVATIALLAMPAAGLANCPTKAAAAPHSCCAKTIQQAAEVMAAAAAAKPCCNLSSGQPTPATQLQAPYISTVAVHPLQAAAPTVMTIVPLRSDLREAVPLKVSFSSQAVLCTFLI